MKIIQSESEGVLTLLESSRELMLLESGQYPQQDAAVDMVKIVLTIQGRIQSLALYGDVTIKFENRVQKHTINVIADQAIAMIWMAHSSRLRKRGFRRGKSIWC